MPADRSPTPRIRWAALVAVALVLAGLGACSSDASDGATATSSTAGASTVVDPSSTTAAAGDVGAATAPPSTDPIAAPAVEAFTGSLDDFYRVPDPLPAGPAGSLIRTQTVAQDATSVTLRVMYRSVDVAGTPRAVTGIITYPTAAAPEGGWPVVAWAHGTSGLATQCAPSRLGSPAPDFGVADVVRVATDYIGLGPIGERHAYLSGPSEAHSVIDAVRAARTLPDAHASATWAAIGHSQGGHAALWTNELGASYAPELDFRGTVVVAPAAMLTETYGPKDQIVPRTVGIMALYGVATVDPRLDPDDYVSDLVAERSTVLDTGCLDQIIQQLASIFDDDFYVKDPLHTEPAETVVRENDPGQVAVAAPLLLVYGTKDDWVVPDRVHALFDRLCSEDQVTDLVRIDGADHGTVMTQDVPVFTEWLTERLAADPATPPDACADGWS